MIQLPELNSFAWLQNIKNVKLVIDKGMSLNHLFADRVFSRELEIGVSTMLTRKDSHRHCKIAMLFALGFFPLLMLSLSDQSTYLFAIPTGLGFGLFTLIAWKGFKIFHKDNPDS